MIIDPDEVLAIASGLYARRVEQIYGSNGSRALRNVLRAVNIVHRYLPYEIMTGGVTIFGLLEPGTGVDTSALGEGVEITASELSSRFNGAATLQPLSRGRFRFWPKVADDIPSLAGTAVVYHYADGDYFVLDGSLEKVPNQTGFPSAFGAPTFFDLDDALRHYSNALARCSTCHILGAIWYDGNRLVLVNKPEETMRSSLAQFLRCTLRDHELVEIREEQNVDETRPVDIKVAWSFSNRIAIIEVKWLGDTVDVNGLRLGLRYRDARAREGASQLAGYLQRNRPRVPMHITRGYLVVFDARRKGLNRQIVDQHISRADAFYYADREIYFDPRYETVRDDFAPPVRIYLEPDGVDA
jgi:hypothetical protein